MADYIRTKSCDDGIGFRYETKMVALTALRLYKVSDDFQLASNFAKGEKFDDIVFTATFNGSPTTWFVQLKHKQISTIESKKIGLSALRTKDDFNLIKYFHSYQVIADKFRAGRKDVIFGRPFDSVRFALLTNAKFHPAVFVFPPKNIPTILYTNNSEEVNAMFSKEDVKDVFSRMQCYGDSSLDRFLQRFHFCTGMRNENEMDSLIQSEIIGINSELSTIEVNYITHNLYDSIYKWMKTGKFLDKQEIGNIISRTSMETQYGKKNQCMLEFAPSFYKFIKESIKNFKLVALKSKSETTIMCMTFCNQFGLTDPPNKLLSLQQLDREDIRSHLLGDWQSQSNTTLIVDCEGDILGVNMKTVADFLRHLVTINPNNVIILIMTIDNENALSVARLAAAKEIKFNCALAQLAEPSQNVLRDREVIFQGYKTKLNTLMPAGQLNTVFTMELMTLLLLGRSLHVGVKPLDNIPYYVTRVLTRQASTSYELFTALSIPAHFVLSGITLEEAIMNYPFSQLAVSSTTIMNNPQETRNKMIIILEAGDENVFTKLSETVNGDMHWFQLKKGNKGNAQLWQWKQSKHGSNMSYINEYLEENVVDYVPMENIMNMEDKVVVITAEPGMGKSTLLGHLAAVTKNVCPYVWVIYLALNDYTDHFDDENFVKNIKINSKKLIAAAAGVGKETSKFDTRLFDQCYDVTGNMIVLLDGFDEITPYYTVQGLKLIDELKKTKIARVWVTARPQWRDLLEHCTSTLSYNIKSFSEKDQQNFLYKYWKNEIPTINDVNLKDFVLKVLRLVQKSFDSKLHQFTGIPLQTRMIGDVFVESIHSYHTTGILSITDRLDGLQLFQQFVSKKRGIQMEKAKITVTNASAKWEQRKLNEQREKELMSLALLTLLQRNECLQLVPPVTNSQSDELKEMVQNGNEKSGIVVSFKGDVPQFIHRTFAEYFAALFFTKHFTTNREFLASDAFFSDSFTFVKYFYDRILSENNELHQAVLDLNITFIGDAVNTLSVNAKDRGGRTPLHLAAALPESEDIIRLLLQNGGNAKAEDDVLGWRPLQYACKIKALENISPLLENSPESLAKDTVSITWQTLQKALQGDYLQLLLYLLDNGIYEVEMLDDLSPQTWLDDTVSEGLTILHVAAAYNSSEILKYLLNKKTRDSKARLIESVDRKGNTPLLLAGARGCGAAIRELVQSGANTLKKSPDDKNLIQYAVERQDLDILTIAVMDARKRNAAAETFLPSAVTSLIGEKGERLEWANKALQLLFSLYPELSSLKTTKGQPLLQVAIQKGNICAVESLCGLGADVNVLTSNGPLLHYAIKCGDDDITKILLKNKSLDVNACDESGGTAIARAMAAGQSEIVDLLIASGASLGARNVIDYAINNGNVEMLLTLLNHGALDVNKIDEEGHTPLYKAIIADNAAIIEALVDAGATLNETELNTVTPEGPLLHVAVVNGREDVVMAMLANVKLDVNLADSEGFTALHKAAQAGNPDIFQLLINSGANVNHVGKNGSNLTHAVALSQNEAIFFYLLEVGLDFKVANTAGVTALDILKAQKAKDLVKILEPDALFNSDHDVARKSPELGEPPVAIKKSKKKKKSLAGIGILDGSTATIPTDDQCSPTNITAPQPTAPNYQLNDPKKKNPPPATPKGQPSNPKKKPPSQPPQLSKKAKKQMAQHVQNPVPKPLENNDFFTQLMCNKDFSTQVMLLLDPDTAEQLKQKLSDMSLPTSNASTKKKKKKNKAKSVNLVAKPENMQTPNPNQSQKPKPVKTTVDNHNKIKNVPAEKQAIIQNKGNQAASASNTAHTVIKKNKPQVQPSKKKLPGNAQKNGGPPLKPEDNQTLTPGNKKNPQGNGPNNGKQPSCKI